MVQYCIRTLKQQRFRSSVSGGNAEDLFLFRFGLPADVCFYEHWDAGVLLIEREYGVLEIICILSGNVEAYGKL